MIVTVIQKENQSFFQNFLLPSAVKFLEGGSPVTALGLVQDSVACGAAAGYLENDVFQLISLFVAPEYRGKGGGALLLETLRDTLRTIPEIYYINAGYTISRKEHLSLEHFLKKNGFRFREERNSYFSVTLGSLSENGFFANLNEAAELPDGILPFSAIPSVYVKMLMRCLSTEERAVQKEGLSGDGEIDPELSLGVVENGKISAYIIFDYSFAGWLTLAYAGSEPTGKAPSLFPALLRSAFRLALRKFTPETAVVFQTVTPESARLSNRLLESAGGGECLSRFCSLPLLDYSRYGGLFSV